MTEQDAPARIDAEPRADRIRRRITEELVARGFQAREATAAEMDAFASVQAGDATELDVLVVVRAADLVHGPVDIWARSRGDGEPVSVSLSPGPYELLSSALALVAVELVDARVGSPRVRAEGVPPTPLPPKGEEASWAFPVLSLSYLRLFGSAGAEGSLALSGQRRYARWLLGAEVSLPVWRMSSILPEGEVSSDIAWATARASLEVLRLGREGRVSPEVLAGVGRVHVQTTPQPDHVSDDVSVLGGLFGGGVDVSYRLSFLVLGSFARAVVPWGLPRVRVSSVPVQDFQKGFLVVGAHAGLLW